MGAISVDVGYSQSDSTRVAKALRKSHRAGEPRDHRSRGCPEEIDASLAFRRQLALEADAVRMDDSLAAQAREQPKGPLRRARDGIALHCFGLPGHALVKPRRGAG